MEVHARVVLRFLEGEFLTSFVYRALELLCLELGRLAAEPTSGKAWSVTQESCPVPLTVRGTQALVSFAPLAFNLLRVQHTPYDGAVPAAAAAQRTAAVATLRIAAVHRVWSLPRGASQMETNLRDAGFRGFRTRPRSPTIMLAAGRMVSCSSSLSTWGTRIFSLNLLLSTQPAPPKGCRRHS